MKAAIDAQVRAATPSASSWVSANAGSGKTRVLTNRVARLLLAGTEPQKILCLTYTKAAAAEMQSIVVRLLGHEVRTPATSTGSTNAGWRISPTLTSTSTTRPVSRERRTIRLSTWPPVCGGFPSRDCRSESSSCRENDRT